MSESVQYFPPERVLVDSSTCEAVSYERAKVQRIEPDFVLVRDDGWTLGGRWDDAAAAWMTWAESWVFFAYRDDALGGWKIGKLADFGTVVSEHRPGSRSG